MEQYALLTRLQRALNDSYCTDLQTVTDILTECNAFSWTVEKPAWLKR